MNITINVEGYVSAIIDALVEKGIVKTKAEALRLGLLTLNDKYHLLDEERVMYEVAKEISKRVKSGESKLISEKELLKKFPYLKDVEDD